MLELTTERSVLHRRSSMHSDMHLYHYCLIAIMLTAVHAVHRAIPL